MIYRTVAHNLPPVINTQLLGIRLAAPTATVCIDLDTNHVRVERWLYSGSTEAALTVVDLRMGAWHTFPDGVNSGQLPTDALVYIASVAGL